MPSFDTLLTFASAHWPLSLALVVLIIALIAEEMLGKKLGLKSISAALVTQLINRQQAVVVDIRDATLFQAGHLLEAISIPLDIFETKLSSLEKYQQQPLIICAGTNQNTQKLGLLLQKRGFQQLYQLQGGLAAWQNEGFPVTKG